MLENLRELVQHRKKQVLESCFFIFSKALCASTIPAALIKTTWDLELILALSSILRKS